jgi:hypothetical protein
MVRTVVGLLLIAHGLVHLLYLMPRPEDDPSYPFVPETRWSAKLVGLEPSTAKIVAVSLAVAVAVVLLLSGIALFADADIWKVAAATGSLLSLALLLLFFHPWLTIGIAIDAAILTDVWFAHLPSSLFD